MLGNLVRVSEVCLPLSVVGYQNGMFEGRGVTDTQNTMLFRLVWDWFLVENMVSTDTF